MRKRVEEAAHLLFIHANARINHRKLQGQALVGTVRAFHGDLDRTALCELEGITHQIDQDLTQAQRVAHQVRRHGVIHPHPQGQVFLQQLVGKQLGHRAQQVFQIEALVDQLQPASFHLGIIQHIIQDAKQRLPRLTQVDHVLKMRALQRRRLQQLRETQNGIQRRANFMAHVGQKLRLGGRGVLCLLQGLFDLHLLGQGLLQVAALQGLALGQVRQLAFELCAHLQEGSHQRANFIVAVRVESQGVTPFPNLTGRVDQGYEGTGQPSTGQPHQHGENQQRTGADQKNIGHDHVARLVRTRT